MKRIMLAGILGGGIAFVWSAVVHLNPFTAPLGLSLLNEREAPVMAALQSNVPEPGLYFFPGMDLTKRASKEQQEAWTAKYKAGPSGLLLLQPKGGEPMAASQLVIELVSTLLCGLIAAFVLAATVGSCACRVALVGSLGLFAWLAISVSQWDWYAFPFDFIAVDALDQVIGWLLAGLLMVKLIKPANQTASMSGAQSGSL